MQRLIEEQLLFQDEMVSNKNIQYGQKWADIQKKMNKLLLKSPQNNNSKKGQSQQKQTSKRTYNKIFIDNKSSAKLQKPKKHINQQSKQSEFNDIDEIYQDCNKSKISNNVSSKGQLTKKQEKSLFLKSNNFPILYQDQITSHVSVKNLQLSLIQKKKKVIINSSKGLEQNKRINQKHIYKQNLYCEAKQKLGQINQRDEEQKQIKKISTRKLLLQQGISSKSKLKSKSEKNNPNLQQTEISKSMRKLQRQKSIQKRIDNGNAYSDKNAFETLGQKLSEKKFSTAKRFQLMSNPSMPYNEKMNIDKIRQKIKQNKSIETENTKFNIECYKSEKQKQKIKKQIMFRQHLQNMQKSIKYKHSTQFKKQIVQLKQNLNLMNQQIQEQKQKIMQTQSNQKQAIIKNQVNIIKNRVSRIYTQNQTKSINNPWNITNDVNLILTKRKQQTMRQSIRRDQRQSGIIFHDQNIKKVRLSSLRSRQVKMQQLLLPSIHGYPIGQQQRQIQNGSETPNNQESNRLKASSMYQKQHDNTLLQKRSRFPLAQRCNTQTSSPNNNKENQTIINNKRYGKNVSSKQFKLQVSQNIKKKLQLNKKQSKQIINNCLSNRNNNQEKICNQLHILHQKTQNNGIKENETGKFRYQNNQLYEPVLIQKSNGQGKVSIDKHILFKRMEIKDLIFKKKSKSSKLFNQVNKKIDKENQNHNPAKNVLQIKSMKANSLNKSNQNKLFKAKTIIEKNLMVENNISILKGISNRNKNKLVLLRK